MITLQIGDILNTKNPIGYGLKNITGWIFKLGVFDYQKRMFKNRKENESLWSTHSRIYLGNNLWLSVTTPKAKIEYIDIDKFDTPHTICRYIHSHIFSSVQHNEIKKVADSLNGTKYDYKQIGAMLLHSLFPNLIPDQSKFLKADGDKVVCSVGALACLIAAWKTTDRLLERPGGDPMDNTGIYLEEFPPAGFNYHHTFETIWKHKW